MGPILWQRPGVLLGGGAALLGACARSERQAVTRASAHLADVETGLGGRLGVAAVDTETGTHVSHRSAERFAMCSTFKWILAAAVLAKIDRSEIRLNQPVMFTASDLLPFSSVTEAHVADGSMPVERLCEAAVEVSDNTAANALLKLLGGPPVLTHFLRQLGDLVTRLDRTETGLNANVPGDERDTTTPFAMTKTMNQILVGNALSPGSRDKLVGWMKNCRTGLDRLRAGLPHDWVAGDKTGTGANGAANDNAIIWPPGRSPILVAAYLTGSQADPEKLNAAHAEIGRIIAAAFA